MSDFPLPITILSQFYFVKLKITPSYIKAQTIDHWDTLPERE
ncbi:hypothetical protein QET93_011100 [Akkermansia sp. N21116]|nr:hypothetical protein [Akkermansia sp. N21116]WPX40078.1 hypothetical protein QET93_011100 [Akkermansia sp. N21116]